MTNIGVAWWNLENLFQSENDPNRDLELQRMLKSELVGWNVTVRDRKIANLARVIEQMFDGKGPDLLGVCEVESEAVLRLLVNQINLPNRNYSVVSHDSTNCPSIDISFIVDRNTLTPGNTGEYAIRRSSLTRDMFWVRLTINATNQQFVAIGNHGPELGPRKLVALEELNPLIYELQGGADKGRDLPILVMGDFNHVLQSSKKPLVFLSYAREDEEVVRRLGRKLAREGFESWIDSEDIAAGVNWADKIEDAMGGCDFFVACISQKSVRKRGFLRQEWQKGVEVSKKTWNGYPYLIPVRLDNVGLPELLKDNQWLDMGSKRGWKKQLASLRDEFKRRVAVRSKGLPPASQAEAVILIVDDLKQVLRARRVALLNVCGSPGVKKAAASYFDKTGSHFCDQFLASRGLLLKNSRTKILLESIEVISPKEMRDHLGRPKAFGRPSIGRAFNPDGFSDHFPITVYLCAR